MQRSAFIILMISIILVIMVIIVPIKSFMSIGHPEVMDSNGSISFIDNRYIEYNIEYQYDIDEIITFGNVRLVQENQYILTIQCDTLNIPKEEWVLLLPDISSIYDEVRSMYGLMFDHPLYLEKNGNMYKVQINQYSKYSLMYYTSEKYHEEMLVMPSEIIQGI